MRTKLVISCLTLSFPTLVSAATEFDCLHTCPPLIEGEFCNTTFVEIKDDFMVSLTDDVLKAVGQLEDGRLANVFWKPLIKYDDRMILVSDVDTDDVLGAQIAVFDFVSKNFTMGAIGVVLSAGAKSESYQVVGKCTAKQL
jgi:hypothetical protein